MTQFCSFHHPFHYRQLIHEPIAACPQCNSGFTYEDAGQFVCPECAHEWKTEALAESDDKKIYRDSAGNADQGLILSKNQMNGMVSADPTHEWSNVMLTRETLQPDGLNTVDVVRSGDFNPAEIYQ